MIRTRLVSIIVAILSIFMVLPAIACHPGNPTPHGQDTNCDTPPPARFELVLGGEGVLDTSTGLTWEQSPSDTAKTYLDAILYCYSSTVGGVMGWYLPTIPEQTSILDPNEISPALPIGHLFDTNTIQNDRYWALTPHERIYAAQTSEHLFLVSLDDATIVGRGLALETIQYAWCVRK